MFGGKTFAEKTLERKGRDYDYDTGKLERENARLRDALAKIAHSNAQTGTDALAMREIAMNIIYPNRNG